MAAAFLFALLLAAEPWPLERLFTRPFAWGTRPSQLAWSKQGHTLVFLWNAEGRRFLDLYGYHPDARRLARLTDLEPVRDELNLGAAEKDDRRKHYLEPGAGLGGFDLSADGRRAVFAYQNDLYLVETAGGRPPVRLTRTKSGESSPRLSPDGGRLAYLRDGQILVQDLADGRTWQASDTQESIETYRWSPDGKQFFYVTLAGSERELLLPNYSGRLVTARNFKRSLAGDDPVAVNTYVVAAEGGKAARMDPGPWEAKVYAEVPEWSPDSARLLQRFLHLGLQREQIVVQDAATGRSRVVFEEQDSAWVEPVFATWSPDGKEILFTSERDGWSHLYKIADTRTSQQTTRGHGQGAPGGEARQLTRGPWEIHTESFSHDPEWVGGFIYYSSTEAGASERQFYRIRPDGSGKERLSAGEGVHTGRVSADGRYIALLSADLDHPLDLYVNGERVTASTSPEFRRYPWPETRFVSFPSRADGKTVYAKLLLPPGYRPEDRSQAPRPAVFFIHGAGYATSVLKQWGSYMDVRFVFNCHLANQGYVVMDLDYRGSSGYGRDWRTGVYLHMGGPDLADVLGAVDYLGGLGNIDLRRIGIWGSSYGGFLTNMTMFLAPEAFRAGVSWAAVNDWENYNAFYTEQRLTKPQQNPEAYRRSSPIYFSGGLKNPLLLIHGMVDSNVLFQDAVQLSEKLIQEGKIFEQFYYPEEDHLFVRDETLIDVFRRSAEFLSRRLR
ncbi:MAG: S9 family peptidase [Acidobacteria bacterium]|nr:S9 family peptidase [Acidobacteriota bacterium]